MVLACCGAIMPCGTSIITGTTPGPFLAETAGPSHPKAQERTQFTDSERFRFGTRKSNRHSEERQSGQPDPALWRVPLMALGLPCCIFAAIARPRT